MLFSIISLILTEALPQRVLFSLFCLILTKVLQQRVFYCIFDLIFDLYLAKALPLRVLFFFALVLIKALPKRGVSLLLPVSKVAKIRNRYNQLILTKALPQRVFDCLFSNSNQSPAEEGVFLYFCPYSNESSTTNSVFFSILHLFKSTQLKFICKSHNI